MRIRRKSFTLIELLVVIAIIGILASLLLPALQKAKAMGYRAQCVGNMKSMGLGIAEYQNDYNDYVPCSRGVDGKEWVHKIYPYLSNKNPDDARNSKIFDCPAPRIGTSWFDYGANLYFFKFKGTAPNTNFKFKICGPRPSIKVAVADYTNSFLNTGWFPPYIFDQYHETGLNFLYMDGHVAFDQGRFYNEDLHLAFNPPSHENQL